MKKYYVHILVPANKVPKRVLVVAEMNYSATLEEGYWGGMNVVGKSHIRNWKVIEVHAATTNGLFNKVERITNRFPKNHAFVGRTYTN